MKKGNTIPAMIIIVVVLASSVLLYFTANSNIGTQHNEIDSYNPDLIKIKEVLNEITINTKKEINFNGYSNTTYLWFENAPYPPNTTEFIIYTNHTINEIAKDSFNKVNKITSGNLNINNYNIDMKFEPKNNKLIYNFKNITYETNKSNFYFKKNFNFSINLSEDYTIYKNLHNWSTKEGVEMFNKIINTFNGSCGISCTCDDIPATGIKEPEFNINKIHDIIDNQVSELNLNYFYNTDITCNYEILDEIYLKNPSYEYLRKPGDSYCNPIGSQTTTASVPKIWDDKETIIDYSTISYQTQSFNYIKRILPIPENIINIILTLSTLNPLENQDTKPNNPPYGLGDQAIGLREKYEPSMGIKIRIECINKKNYQTYNGVSQPLKTTIGYRINVIKQCEPGYPPIQTNEMGCSKTGDCHAYMGCDENGAICITDDSDINPNACPRELRHVSCIDECKGQLNPNINNQSDCENIGGNWQNPFTATVCHITYDNGEPKCTNPETVSRGGCCINGNWEGDDEIGKLVTQKAVCINGENQCIPQGAQCAYTNAQPGGSCFTKGTKIALSNNEDYKYIEDIKIGDKVLTYDLNSSKFIEGTVQDIETPIRDAYYHVVFEDKKYLNVTNDHPLYAKNTNYTGWVSIDPHATLEEYKMIVKKIKLNDSVMTYNKTWKKIINITKIEGPIQTYNLHKISPTKTFFANSILVHNKGDEPIDPNPEPPLGTGTSPGGTDPVDIPGIPGEPVIPE